MAVAVGVGGGEGAVGDPPRDPQETAKSPRAATAASRDTGMRQTGFTASKYHGKPGLPSLRLTRP